MLSCLKKHSCANCSYNIIDFGFAKHDRVIITISTRDCREIAVEQVQLTTLTQLSHVVSRLSRRDQKVIRFLQKL